MERLNSVFKTTHIDISALSQRNLCNLCENPSTQDEHCYRMAWLMVTLPHRASYTLRWKIKLYGEKINHISPIGFIKYKEKHRCLVLRPDIPLINESE